MNKLLLLCALLLSALLPTSARAAECTEITSAPATITGGGHYCLGANLVVNSTSGSVIEINTNQVDLDCRGYAIYNTATTSSGNAYGIYINNRHNVRVHGCRITGGFAAGIYAYQDNGLANQSRNLEFDGNMVSGAYWYGILAYGTSISIHDNRIHDIGGRASFAMGIRVGSSNLSGEPRFHVVRDNEISDIESPGNNSYGIYANNADGSLFTGNAIHGVRSPNPNYDAFGIFLYTGATNSRITDNTITGTSVGSDVGIFAPASNPCFDNLLRGLSNAVLNCDATHGNF